MDIASVIIFFGYSPEFIKTLFLVRKIGCLLIEMRIKITLEYQRVSTV